MTASDYFPAGTVIHGLHRVYDVAGEMALDAGQFATVIAAVPDPPRLVLWIKPHNPQIVSVKNDDREFCIVWPCMIGRGTVNGDGMQDWVSIEAANRAEREAQTQAEHDRLLTIQTLAILEKIYNGETD